MNSRLEIIGPAECWLGDTLRVLPAMAGLYAPLDAVVTDPIRAIPAGIDGRGFLAWAAAWLAPARALTARGGLLACSIDWRRLPALTDAVQAAGWTWRGIAAWAIGPSRFLVWASNGAATRHFPGKPLHLVDEIVALVSAGGRILDPFMGAGSTGVACLRTGRRFVGIECEPYWHSLAVARLAEEQGRPPPSPPGGGASGNRSDAWHPPAGALELLAGAA